MSEVIIMFLVFAGVAGLALALVSGVPKAPRQRDERRSRMVRARPADVDGRLRVTVDVRVRDPQLPAAQRLIDRAARAHVDRPGVHVVEVLDLEGRVLGHGHHCRPEEAPPGESDSLMAETTGPVRTADLEAATAGSVTLGPSSRGRTSLTGRLDLPAGLSRALGDPTSVGALVAALLQTSDTAVTMRDGVIVAGDMAIVPIDTVEPTGRVIEVELDEAYLRFKASGARVGIAITDGQLPPREVDRRHLLAPELRYCGIEAIQRLADGVVLGGDATAALRDLTATGENPTPLPSAAASSTTVVG